MLNKTTNVRNSVLRAQCKINNIIKFVRKNGVTTSTEVHLVNRKQFFYNAVVMPKPHDNVKMLS